MRQDDLESGFALGRQYTIIGVRWQQDYILAARKPFSVIVQMRP